LNTERGLVIGMPLEQVAGSLCGLQGGVAAGDFTQIDK
jgi:hypothetical protein